MKDTLERLLLTRHEIRIKHDGNQFAISMLREGESEPIKLGENFTSLAYALEAASEYVDLNFRPPVPQHPLFYQVVAWIRHDGMLTIDRTYETRYVYYWLFPSYDRRTQKWEVNYGPCDIFGNQTFYGIGGTGIITLEDVDRRFRALTEKDWIEDWAFWLSCPKSNKHWENMIASHAKRDQFLAAKASDED